MDFQQFGIDERLLSGVPSLRNQALFHEKMLTHAVKQGENVYARISVSEGREAIYLLPALQWLASGAGAGESRVLCLVPDLLAARKSAAAALSIGSGIGLETCVVSLEGEGTEAGQPGQAAAAPIIEGDPHAAFVTGSLGALLAAQNLIGLKAFGYLLVDGAEHIAELPSERIRHFSSALRPSWERRAIVVCGRNSAKAKNLAWDLSENPVEFHIEEDAAKAQSVSQESWHIASDMKLRFLLGLLARRRPVRTCVFCNLKSGAEELALRLRYNGVEADYILGSLPPDRKAGILSDLAVEEGSVLVLTDEGAVGIKGGSFPLVVNYDIPLDPELYVRRLEMLDRAGASSGIVNLACDRYVYGLPAVEQYIDASLDAKPVDESLLRAEDKSADLVFERPRFDREAPRGASRVGRLVEAGETRRMEGAPRRAEGEARRGQGETRRSGGQGHENRRGSGREEDSRQARQDRSPDIRRRIAEATGGSLSVTGLSAQEESGHGSQPPNGGQRNGGGVPAQGRQAQGKPAQSGPGKAKSDVRHAQGGKKSSSAGEHRRPAAQDGGRRGPALEESNPYALSMEERMLRYREKYGQGAEGGKTPKHGATQKPSAQKPKGQPNVSSPKPAVQEEKAPRSAPVPSTPKPKKGILGRLFGASTKKSD